MDRYTEFADRMNEKRQERTAMYAGLVLSGFLTGFFPSTVVTAQVNLPITYTWSACMIASASLCLYGSITDKWIGEFSGIPLLASVLTFYAGAIGFSAYDDRNLIVLAFGLILFSFALGLMARWQDVRVIKRQAVEQGRQAEGG